MKEESISSCGHRLTTPGQPEPLLTIGEVAEWVGLSVSTLYHDRTNRDLPPYIKICGRRRYKRCCVQAWIDSHFVQRGA